MKQRTLVLGASSDIGIEVIKLLLNDQNEIHAHCNSNSKKLVNLSNNKKIKIIKKDFSKINQANLNIFLKKRLNYSYSKVVNLIGYHDKKKYQSSDINSIFKSLKINAVLPIFIVRHVVKKMLKYKYGRIINCSSIGVKYGGGTNSFNYSFSKHSSEFIPNVYKSWAKKNVLINNLRIGLCDTKLNKFKTRREMQKRIKLIPIGRISSPEEIAKYIYLFISDTNTYITNENINISGGD